MSDPQNSAAGSAQHANESHRHPEKLDEEVAREMAKAVAEEGESSSKTAKDLFRRLCGLSNSLDNMATKGLQPDDVDDAMEQFDRIKAKVNTLGDHLSALSFLIKDPAKAAENVKAAKAAEAAEAAKAAKAAAKADRSAANKVLRTIKGCFLYNDNGIDLILSANEIETIITSFSSQNAKKDTIKDVATKFHNCLSLFLPTAIVARIISETRDQTAQADAGYDESVSVQAFFQENTTDGYVDILMKQQTTGSMGDKQAFIAGINSLIGIAVINDSLKEEIRAASPGPSGRRGAGNAAAIERSQDIARLTDKLNNAGHSISHKDVKDKLAMGELWKDCIDPYSEGVWRVLPVYEFFDALGFTYHGRHSAARIPRAYIKTLFRCIGRTAKLHAYLLEACADVETFMSQNIGDHEQKVWLHGNSLVDGRVPWTHGSTLVPRAGNFEMFTLEGLHQCVDTFKACYDKDDFEQFIINGFWSELITLLVMGISASHEIEPKYKFECLSMDSSDESKKWNAALLDRFSKAKGDRVLTAFFHDTNAENHVERVYLVIFKPRARNNEWKVHVMGTDSSDADDAWRQQILEIFPAQDENSQATLAIGDIEYHSVCEGCFGKGAYSSRDDHMIWLVLQMVALAFTSRTMDLSDENKNHFDLGIIAKVMQRQMVRGLMKAAPS